MEVDVSDITSPSEFQTRAGFDADSRPEDTELVESVKGVGVRVPIHVQSVGHGGYSLRAGHRRLAAARLAGLDRVPAIVWPPDADVYQGALDGWLENLHRVDLAPLERARALARILDRFELPRSGATARKLGLSKTSFYRYLRLLEAPEDVRQALSDGHLSVRQADELRTVANPQARRDLLAAAKGGTSAAAIDERIRQQRPRPEKRTDSQRIDEAGRRRVRQLFKQLHVSAVAQKQLLAALDKTDLTEPHAACAVLLTCAGEDIQASLNASALVPIGLARALAAMLDAWMAGVDESACEVTARLLRQAAAIFEAREAQPG
jgi:ParB family chromosome partitioning protein